MFWEAWRKEIRKNVSDIDALAARVAALEEQGGGVTLPELLYESPENLQDGMWELEFPTETSNRWEYIDMSFTLPRQSYPYPPDFPDDFKQYGHTVSARWYNPYYDKDISSIDYSWYSNQVYPYLIDVVLGGSNKRNIYILVSLFISVNSWGDDNDYASIYLGGVTPSALLQTPTGDDYRAVESGNACDIKEVKFKIYGKK